MASKCKARMAGKGKSQSLRRKSPAENESELEDSVDRSLTRSDQASSCQSTEAEAADQRLLKKKKSFTKDVKDKLSFLRRRHTESSLKVDGQTDGTMGVDKILAWRKSFDNLLQDKVGIEMFRDFLRTEFSEENIEFWVACEEYKHSKSNKIVAEAQKIFADFIAVQATHEINLDSKTRLVTKNNMTSPNKHTFEQAQKRIQALMEKDSYPRFLRSEPYQQLLRDHKVT
jgi:regulator of G-protein signaling